MERDYDNAKLKSVGREIARKTVYGFHKASLTPNTTTDLDILVEENQDEIDLQIWFYLQNGLVTEKLHVQNIKEIKKKLNLEIKRGDKVLEKR